MSEESAEKYVVFRQRLLTLKDELTKRTEKIKLDLYARREPLSQDFSEQAVEQENFDVLEGLYREGMHEIEQINTALRRIDQGNYGICQKCQEDINLERLQAVPYAVLCVDCAE